MPLNIDDDTNEWVDIIVAKQQSRTAAGLRESRRDWSIDRSRMTYFLIEN